MSPFEHFKRRRKYGITDTAVVLLDLCRRWPEPGCTKADLMRLAKKEQVASHMTMLTAINSLIDLKLIEQHPCKIDMRAKRLIATKTGKRFLADYRARPDYDPTRDED